MKPAVIILFFLLQFAFSLFETNTSNAITDTLSAEADNTLYEDNSGGFSNGSGNYFFAGKTNIGYKRRGLIRFAADTKIPPGAVITGVTLRLYMSRTISLSETVSLHKVTAEWGEGASVALGNEGSGTSPEQNDATWIHSRYPDVFWNNPGGDYSAAASAVSSINSTGYYSWSSSQMISDVQNWINNPCTEYGWILIGNEVTTANSKRFDTRENFIAANRPVLIVQYNFNNLGLVFDGIPEGFRTAGGISANDTMRVFLRNSSSPYTIADNAKVCKGIQGAVSFLNAGTGNYYVQVSHRNSISVWSANTVSYTSAGTVKTYLFTTCACRAYGNNQVPVFGKNCFYGGDTNQDGIVDASDYSEIDNAANEFISGYVNSDLTGDEIVDGTDASICENNASNFISVISP